MGNDQFFTAGHFNVLWQFYIVWIQCLAFLIQRKKHFFDTFSINGTVTLSLVKKGAHTGYSVPMAAYECVTFREGEKAHTSHWVIEFKFGMISSISVELHCRQIGSNVQRNLNLKDIYFSCLKLSHDLHRHSLATVISTLQCFTDLFSHIESKLC